MKKRLAALFLCISFVCFADTNKIAEISIPKCGNFLLMKLIRLISKKQPKTARLYNINMDWQHYFFINHELAKRETVEFCKNNNIKAVFIFRDPRDQVVSGAYYLKKCGLAKNMSMSELITALIHDSFHWWRVVGPPDGKGTIAEFYHLFLPWREFDFVYTTTFENIIGSKGNGERQLQIEEIKSIAAFCGYNLTKDEVEAIADSLWGNRNTFREGKIGAWKKEFSVAHIKLFKEVAGQLLIDLGYENDFNW